MVRPLAVALRRISPLALGVRKRVAADLSILIIVLLQLQIRPFDGMDQSVT